MVTWHLQAVLWLYVVWEISCFLFPRSDQIKWRPEKHEGFCYCTTLMVMFWDCIKVKHKTSWLCTVILMIHEIPRGNLSLLGIFLISGTCPFQIVLCIKNNSLLTLISKYIWKLFIIINLPPIIRRSGQSSTNDPDIGLD